MTSTRTGRIRPALFALALAASATVAAGTLAPQSQAAPTAAAAACANGYVALTFDDGPKPGDTTGLLAALKASGARATLFNIGGNAAANPSLVAAERNAGMWIGNHSYTHPHLTTLPTAQVRQELASTQQAIANAGGGQPVLFRPPYGEVNASVRSVASSLGLATIIWTVDTQDWNGHSTDQIVASAATAQPGGVILMHDGYATTRAAIPRIVAGLTARGLCPGRISPSTGQAVAP